MSGDENRGGHAGRPVRVLIAKAGLDGHDVGAKVVCLALRDAGMEVIYTGLRQSPDAIAQAAVQEDVDVIGLSCLSGAHLELCRRLRERLDRVYGKERPLWIVGGNIPEADRKALEEAGVDGVFPTSSGFGEIVDFIRGRTGGE